MMKPLPKKLRAAFVFSLVILAFIPGKIAAQVFWTESFNNGCSAGCLATTYVGPNGAWTQTVTGAEGADPNLWYVSCAENGHTPTVCGSACQAASATATLASLHVGSNPNSLGDAGAAYDAGGLCGILTCPQTNRRVESPTINCTGKTNITLAFNYIENGDPPNDDASVWYYNGATWSLLSNTPQTLTNCPGGQGRWTAFSVALPASADNNPNVKIGFLWVNNDDGAGTDPSFAVDEITLSTPASSAPVAAFTASATSVCVGQSVNFTDNSTGSPTSWSWTFPSGTPGTSTSQNPSGIVWNTAGTYTVTLTATNASGSSSSTVTITVNPLPTITASASPTSVCNGQSVTLTGGGGSTYVWNPGNISGSPVSVTPGATTTYTVTGTSAAGCSNTATVAVTVTPGPTVTASASPTSICSGQQVTLTGSGANTYVWNPGNVNGSSVSVSPGATTTYTVTGTDLSGCQGNATVTVTVNPTPTVTATANPATLCVGQTVTLTGGGATTYNWMPGNINGSPVTDTPATTTTYTVTGTTAGCSATQTVTVIVNTCTVPNVNFTASDTTLCVGDCINFTDNTGGSPTSWNWTFAGAATGSSTAQNPTNICYNSAGTFAVTLTATNANGTGTLTKTGYITVNPSPAANAGPDATICTGQSTTLLGSGGTTYNWMPGNGNSSSFPVTPAATTTYTLTVTDANGCTGTDQVTVTVITCAPPVAALTVSDNNICQSTCIDFTDMSTGTPTGWSWSFPGATPSSSSAQNPTNICYNSPGNYNVTLIVTNAFGTDTIVMNNAVTVVALPVISAGQDTTLAIGNSVQLHATGGSGGSYVWTPATGLSNPNVSNPLATPLDTTTYLVTYTNSAGCTAQDSVTVFVLEAYAIFVPSAFSPNGDGRNDILFVRGAGIKEMDFVVFDRVGEKVFESFSVNEGWDGTFRGKEMDTGIYTWYVTATFYNGTNQVLHGDVSLVR